MSTNNWSVLPDRSGEVYNTPLEKPVGDKREYQYIRLWNKLEALIISDRDVNRTHAAMSINIGNDCDSEDEKGLSVLWASMICYEGKIKEIKEKLSGDTSPYIFCDRVEFEFSVNHKCSEDALKYFSQGFCEPHFEADLIPEYLNLKDPETDALYDYDLITHVQQITSDPNHPWSSNIQRSVMIQNGASEELCNRLEKFHNKYLSANTMKLCVMGKDPLTQLTALVRRIFSEIPNKNVEIPTYKTHPLSSNELSREVLTETKEEKSVEFLFPITDNIVYGEVETSYLPRLIDSCFDEPFYKAILESGCTCNDIMVDTYSVCKNGTFLCVNIQLTNEGIEKYEDVLFGFFAFMADRKKEGIQNQYFKEQTEQHFDDNQQDIREWAGKMHYTEDPRWTICSRKVNPDVDKEIVDKHLEIFRPENCCVYLSAPTFPFETHMVEKEKGGIKYQCRPISDSVIEKINSYFAKV